MKEKHREERQEEGGKEIANRLILMYYEYIYIYINIEIISFLFIRGTTIDRYADHTTIHRHRKKRERSKKVGN